jgi:putative ABC transport system substrate-binding protein
MVMNRRALLLALASAPFLANAANEPRRKRLVIVEFRPQQLPQREIDEVVRILGARGFVQGRQLEVVRVTLNEAGENATVTGPAYLVPLFERQVLSLKPDVILTMGSVMVRTAHAATQTIPIVTSVADPVELGVAASLARPGGNVTGLAQGTEATSEKLMELMKRSIPGLARVAIFHHPRPMATRLAGHYQRAAKSVGLEPVMVAAAELPELLQALRGLRAKRIQAGVWSWDSEGLADATREAIAARVPLVGMQEDAAEAGCLLSFYSSETATYAKLTTIVEQILRGADPAGIPFQYPQAFRLVINRRTARAMGFTLTPELLLRVDRVID